MIMIININLYFSYFFVNIYLIWNDKRDQLIYNLFGDHDFWNQADKQTFFAIMDKAFEAGANFFDTADVYPPGGKKLASYARRFFFV
ncbi:Aldo/keto reductase family protein [Aneurinibacillus thermoaerophilus]|uniref:Aldo/keto reductase family protein n=2 Tax=Aneurinibacillus thermoaerophilus TaxID=143495 RepID=A0A1G7WBX4_ANETH|nr:Aldo/keto reductase family protein [Aneurinibacillus thermoaerophilus]